MQKDDPNGPILLVSAYDPGAARPNPRKYLSAPGFKITRTYSLTASLDKYSGLGVKIVNKVFTDMDSGARILPVEVVEEYSPEAVSWRRGFYDKPRSWEQEGPKPGDENQITRRFASQKGLTAPEMPPPRRAIEERLSAKAQQLSRQAAKRKRQARTLKKQPAQDEGNGSDSSSSTSGSTSSSSSATS